MTWEEKLNAIDWYQFERLISLLFETEGDPVQRRGGAHADGGVDLIVTTPDNQEVLIQCKHWRSWDVGVRHVRELLGSMKDFEIDSAILITLRGYTGEAKSLAEKHQIVILNGRDVVQMIQEVRQEVRTKIDQALVGREKRCSKCENPMILRTARKGANAGGQFWGCSKYPVCRYTLQVVVGKS